MRRIAELFTVALVAAVVAVLMPRAIAQSNSEFEWIAVTDEVYFDEWAGIRVIGLNDGTCPSNFSLDTNFQGRMIVGTPSGGTDGGTSGPALTNQEVRRGGTAQTLTANQSGHSHGNGDLAVTVTHSHGSGSLKIDHSDDYQNLQSFSSGSNRYGFTTGADDNVTGSTASASPSSSVTGSTASIDPTIAVDSVVNQTQPAPYIQVPICVYNP